jgi:cytochrome c553
MRRSVATHALAVEAPPHDLRSDALVMRGAGHYHHGCRVCHGAPGEPMPRVPAQMTPHPPWLPDRMPGLSPGELFYVVKHGVKFTGMPAWPSRQRDDEVWSLVAFVVALPDLDRSSYSRLVHDPDPVPADAPPVVERVCAGCHGDDGQGRVEGAFPRLAGQSETYLLQSLRAYADGRRHSGIMEPIAARLTDMQMRSTAHYFATLPPMKQPNGESSEGGEAIATQGIPEQKIASCVDCHGPIDRPRNGAYPILAGQDRAYLEQQLQLFTQQRRGGAQYADLMQSVASHRLTPEQIREVARFYASAEADVRR